MDEFILNGDSCRRCGAWRATDPRNKVMWRPCPEYPGVICANCLEQVLETIGYYRGMLSDDK